MDQESQNQVTPEINNSLIDANHPWLGLYPYTEATHSYFYGRDSEINEIYDRVRDNPLTILYGQSGYGKSSMLGAGLVPKLREEQYRPVLIRIDYSSGASSPLNQTKTALCHVLAIDTPPEDVSLWGMFHNSSKLPPNLRDQPPVLIFDQFEEIFTLSHDCKTHRDLWFTEIADLIENRPPKALQERFRKDRSLTRSFEFDPSPVRVVITLREDYLSHLEQHKNTLHSLMRNRMPLRLLAGPQALEAVVRPGAKGSKPIVSMEVGAIIVRKVAQCAADTPLDAIEAVPPYLSLLCEQLNAARLKENPPLDRITAEIVSLHGDKILDHYYEESFQNQPQAVRTFVEDQLVSDSGHRISLARQDVEKALSDSGVSNPAGRIDELIQRRLLNSENRRGIPTLELTHDVLISQVTSSRAVRHKQEAQEAIIKEQKKRQQQKKISYTLALFFLLSCFFALDSWRSDKKAQSAVVESNHNYGLALLEKAEKLEKDKNFNAAYLYALYARKYIKAEDTDSIERAIRVNVGSRITPIIYKTPDMDFDSRNSSFSAAFSPDGETLAFGSGKGEVIIWDVASRQVQRRLKLKGNSRQVNTVCFSPDGKTLATGINRGDVILWDVATGQDKFALVDSDGFRSSADSVCFSPDGRTLVSMMRFGKAIIQWDAISGKKVKIQKLNQKHEEYPAEPVEGIRCINYGPDGKTIAISVRGESVLLWDMMSSKIIHNFQRDISDERSIVNSICYSPDGKTLATGFYDNIIILWDVKSGKMKRMLKGHSGPVMSVRFSPDGKILASGSDDKTIILWDVVSGEINRVIDGQFNSVKSVNFSPDGKMLVTCSEDNKMLLWDLASTVGSFILNDHSLNEGIEFYEKNILHYSPDSKMLITTLLNGKKVVFLDIERGEVNRILERNNILFKDIIFRPDGKILASSCDDNSLILLNIENWDVKRWYVGICEPTSFLSHSPDGKILAQNFPEKSLILLLDVSSGVVKRLPYKSSLVSKEKVSFSQPSLISRICFSPNGKLIAFGELANKFPVIIMNVENGTIKHKLDGHGQPVTNVSFSPDGKTLASSSYDNSIILWDVENGNKKQKLEGQQAYGVNDVNFSPDGKTLASASRDNTVILWDAASSKPKRTLKGHSSPVASVRFSPDGRTLASISEDNTVILWDLKYEFMDLKKIIEDTENCTQLTLSGMDLIPKSATMLQMGLMYERENKLEKARIWYQKALESGDKDAAKRLEKINERIQKLKRSGPIVIG